MELSSAAIMVLRTLSMGGSMDVEGIAGRCALPSETVRRILRELERDGLAFAEGAAGKASITEAGSMELYLYNTV